LYAKEKSQQEPAAQYHNIVHRMEKEENDVGDFVYLFLDISRTSYSDKAALC